MKHFERDKKTFGIKILIPTLLLLFSSTLGIFLSTMDSNEFPNIKGVGLFILTIFIVNLVTFVKINLLFDKRLEKAFASEFIGMEYELIGDNIIIKRDGVTECARIEDIQNITLEDNYFIITTKNFVAVVPRNNKDDEVMESIIEHIK